MGVTIHGMPNNLAQSRILSMFDSVSYLKWLLQVKRNGGKAAMGTKRQDQGNTERPSPTDNLEWGTSLLFNSRSRAHSSRCPTNQLTIKTQIDIRKQQNLPPILLSFYRSRHRRILFRASNFPVSFRRCIDPRRISEAFV